MKEVSAEGTKYIYFSKDTEFPVIKIEGLSIEGMPEALLWKEIMSKSMFDMRAVLVIYPVSPDKGFVYFLHWDDGTNLDELDDKVKTGTYTDDDFVNSIRTQFVLAKCRNAD